MTTTNVPETRATPSDSDRVAVAALTQRVIAAWAYQDADAFASVFTEDGTMILPGVYRKGRDEIRAYMAEAFAGEYRGTQVTGKPIDMRFLGSDAAVLLSLGGVLHAGESEVAQERSIRASWLVVRQNNEWRLAAYQNSPTN